MDLEPEKIHDCLNAIGLPSTVADLKNPTEDYVINLLMQFLNRFYIDLPAIERPTVEQMSSVSLAEHNKDIIALLNLSTVIVGIGNHIFLRDFCLTDLTCPTRIKTRKVAKVLSNFLLYSANKNVAIEERLEEVRHKRQCLDDINREINKYKELKSQKALEIDKTMKLEEQIHTETAKIGLLKGTRKAKIAQIQEKLKASEKEKREIVHRHGMLTTEAIRVSKVTEDLESKLVRSPERFKSQLKKLLEQKKNQVEKREVMEEAMKSKKPTIERIQSYLTVVSNAHAKCLETIEDIKHLTKLKEKLAQAKKEEAEINLLIKEETAVPTAKNNEAVSAILQKTEEQCDQNLAAIRNEFKKLLNEKKSLELKLANDQSRQQELFSERNEIRMSIQKTETETEQFLAYCQELYDSEIKRLRSMKSSLEEKNLES